MATSMPSGDILHKTSKLETSSPEMHVAQSEESKQAFVGKKETRQEFFDPSLLTRLRSQIEFYFSPKNLSRDIYLRSLLVYNHYPTGAVPLYIIASFPKVRSLCTKDMPNNVVSPVDAALIARSLEGSEVVAVSPDMNWIISLFPTPPLIPMPQHRGHTQQITPTSQPNKRIPNDVPTPDNLVDQTSQLQINPVTKERTTVILRDIPEDCNPKEVLAAFTTETIEPKSARPDIGDTWYVSFNSEADAVAAVFASRDRKIAGLQVRARIKSEQNRSSEASRSSSPSTSIPISPGISDSARPNARASNNQFHSTSSSMGLQPHVSNQTPPPNYARFSHGAETGLYLSQQQQLYQPHYGMPLHTMHNRHKTLPGLNYSFSPHMQPYAHHGNQMHYPVPQQNPYFINNLAGGEIPSNLVPNGRENFNDGRQRYGGHRNPQTGSVYVPAGGNLQNDSKNTQVSANPSDHGKSNANVNQKSGMNGRTKSDSNNMNLSKENDLLKSSAQENDQMKRHKNASQNRNFRGDSTTNHGKSETSTKSNSLNNKQRGKTRKNRKNHGNSNGNQNGQSSGKSSFKEPIVINKLNFPELKTEKSSKSNVDSEDVEDVNGTKGPDANASAAKHLTGYAAALRQKRNTVSEGKIQDGK